MKIGVFGGAFNPVHNGHIHLAESYFDALGLDRLLFIPTACPPHKSARQLASACDRLNMLTLAIGDRDGFAVSALEFERQGKSYTYDTLIALKKQYPEDVFFLIIGCDQLMSFHTWYRYKDILDMVTLCTAARDSEEERIRMLSYAKALDGLDMQRFYLSDASIIPVSSTELREKIRKKQSISDLVPEAVEHYISEKGLYYNV